MNNIEFKETIIHDLICFQKKAYIKDDERGYIRCELYDRNLWMSCERIIAKLDNRDISEPDEEYIIDYY